MGTLAGRGDAVGSRMTEATPGDQPTPAGVHVGAARPGGIVVWLVRRAEGAHRRDAGDLARSAEQVAHDAREGASG
jgi:hypothetical protein